MIYGWTVYLCSLSSIFLKKIIRQVTVFSSTVSRGKPSKNTTVIVALTLLYLFCLADSGLHWWQLDLSFVTNDQSRASIYISVSSPPGVPHLIDNLFTFCTIVIADGLMASFPSYVKGMSFDTYLDMAVFLCLESQILGYLCPTFALLYRNW